VTIQEQTERGPQPKQSKKSLMNCLRFAKAQQCLSFGGALKWLSLVALFEKSLGTTPTPKMWTANHDGTDKREMNFDSVAMVDGHIEMKQRKRKSR